MEGEQWSEHSYFSKNVTRRSRLFCYDLFIYFVGVGHLFFLAHHVLIIIQYAYFGKHTYTHTQIYICRKHQEIPLKICEITSY